MSAPVFTWNPSYTPKATPKPRVLEAAFGDGYTQRAADGLNANPITWGLTFTARSNTEAAAIMSFLNSQAGVTPFAWTDFDGVTNHYICQEYSRSRTSTLLNEVTATFVQDFGPQ